MAFSPRPAASRFRAHLQSTGRFLSGMVMPNIGAFMAWGLITACFVPSGWLPNEHLAQLVRPMIMFLLPLLVGYTGGQMVHGTRGGVIGAIATFGAIVGADTPMLLGAMICGPAAAWLLRCTDRWTTARVSPGFEMLVNNFSVGLIGGGSALLAWSAAGPLVDNISTLLAHGVAVVVEHHLLPLTHVVIEPAKVLFLNNAINHGILGPVAMTEAGVHGTSVLFMLESNPGPGLGMLLAYCWLGRGTVRQSAHAAAVIHFLGGIHEIYFPHLLIAPRLLIATIGGGMAGTLTFVALGAGLVAAPSPGSIFAYLAMAPKHGLGAVLAGVAVSTAVSFSIAAILLRFTGRQSDAGALAAAQVHARALKTPPARAPRPAVSPAVVPTGVVFACDAGLGSSAMGASLLRKRFRAAGITLPVTNCAISELPADARLVVTQQSLTPRARQKLPDAEHVSLDDFLKTAVYDELVRRFAPKS
ncbi:PTS mannitol transporter subunit IICB [Opitutus sp. ER46]|uniref:PTS mannitol transporter subunit IICB n=1 Tax=Opitutus sp. ER46 TaxID=2161864 RepID=UPI000D306AED|nr:PTS mannitol transporter subunit IICB [Opitutus sp. ER46]PTX90984.1 PTS mannitol transporter subunit IIBC [Opitutus sp. ER46]